MLRLAVESGGWPGRGRLHAEVTAVEMIPSAAWFRVSTGHQETANQAPDVEQFALHHGYEIDPRYRYTITDTAWKNGGGREYKEAFRRALTDAHAGKFKILIVWALDRIVRDEDGGAEAALRIMRQFRQAGVMVVSVREPWLNGSREVQDVLVAFAGWMAGRESARRSDRIKNGLARRRAEGKPVGRQRGAVDKKQRRRAGYVASWEDGPRRAAQQARTEEAPS
jgi:DNA invertase Pin-like site-specific DNA recombinase